MTWTCPKCERTFARAKQNHACRPEASVDDHFAGKPAPLRKAFDKIVKALEKEGPLRVSAVASSIHLAAGSTFGGVRPQKEKMRVEFLYDADIDSPRIVKRERFSATRYALHVELREAGEVDAELVGWLRRAYRLRA